MKNIPQIWRVVCAVWLVDAFICVRCGSRQHARLAFRVAMLFFAAGMLYRQQRQP